MQLHQSFQDVHTFLEGIPKDDRTPIHLGAYLKKGFFVYQKFQSFAGLVALAGAPGSCKSLFTLQIGISNMVVGNPIIYVNTEMSDNQFVDSYLKPVIHGNIKNVDYKNLFLHYLNTSSLNLLGSENPADVLIRHLMQVLEVNKIALKDTTPLVIIDSFTNLSSLGVSTMEAQAQVAYAVSKIADFVNTSKVNMILVCHASRLSQRVDEDKPDFIYQNALNSFKHTGAIEYLASSCLFLYKTENQIAETETLNGKEFHKQKLRLLVTKNRRGGSNYHVNIEKLNTIDNDFIFLRNKKASHEDA